MITPQSMQTIKKRAACRVAVPSCFRCLARGCFGLPHCCGRRLSLRWGRRGMGALLMAVLVFTGCTPPGARAVLEGKRLLERGDYAQAVEQLRAAVQWMPTNALAFNYLGLAFHQAGQVPEAERD